MRNLNLINVVASMFFLLGIIGKLPLFSQAAQPVEKTLTSNMEPAKVFASTITSLELKDYLSRLASEEFEGRATGKQGQLKAGEFLAEQYKNIGLTPAGDSGTYLQHYYYSTERWDNMKPSLLINGQELQYMLQYFSDVRLNNNRGILETQEMIFLGYGIEDEKYNDYTGQKLAGKDILILSGEPINESGESLVTGSKEPSKWSEDFTMKLQTAYKNGVRTVFIFDKQLVQNPGRQRGNRGSGMTPGKHDLKALSYANNFIIGQAAFNLLTGEKGKEILDATEVIREKGKSTPITFACDVKMSQSKNVNQIHGTNVVGYIKGTDDALSDEVLVISAHYDHLGIRNDKTYFGADDNASGSSGVLEIAEAFQEALLNGFGPRRSVLFLLVSGEEIGLLGSEFYTSNPAFPLRNTIANLNIDMIGRRDDKHRDNPDYIYVIGSDKLSTTLHDINEAVNNRLTNLTLDYTYNAPDDPNRFYFRSDHYNFAKNQIPAIFYFNGTHPDYHQPTDTIDKIEFDKMAKISQLIFFTGWELVNRQERILVNVPQK